MSGGGGSVNPNCPIHGNGGGSYNPNCPIHGNQAGQQSSGRNALPLVPVNRTPSGPILRTLPASASTLPPIAKSQPPPTPTVNQGALDRIEGLLVTIDSNLTTINGRIDGNARTIAGLQERIDQLEETCRSCGQGPSIEDLTAEVIKGLPPMYFQPETADGETEGEPVSKKLGDTVYLFPILRK